MASNRSRHQPPPISCITHKPQRSRSVSNGLEREPKVQPARLLERQLSALTSLNVMPTTDKRHKVIALIEQFEKSKSTENLYQSIENLHRPSSPTSTSSYNSQTPSFKQKDESIQTPVQSASVSQQSLSFTDPKIRTCTYCSSSSIPDHINSNDVEGQTPSKADQPNVLFDSPIMPSDTITVSAQQSLPLPEEFIKWQSNVLIKSASGDSLDKNKTMLIEHIKEIYATEVTYVKTLYVLCAKLPAKMKETCEKDDNLIEIFNNIYQPLLNTILHLYKFHYKIILPHLRKFKTGHRTDHIWSILQEHFQTIEDLYKAYYVAYDDYQRESKRLDKSDSLKKIHKIMLVCRVYLGNLCPITELNCANQRLVRYILLMKSYMKHLDGNSSEYEHTHFIHDELSRIAVRCEEQLLISSAELNRLKLRVDNNPKCFENQQLIWHGSLKKQSPRKRTDISQFYLILFSDCLLVCEESGNKLEIKRQLSIDNITVDIIEGRRLAPITSHSTTGLQCGASIYYPFRINAVEKSYEFLVEKESEREKWVNIIRQTNEDFQHRTSITHIHLPCRCSDKQQFGIRAPVWVYDIDVTRCQICNTRFGLKLIPSARHNCRSCGRCICSSCSSKKLILKYCTKDGEVRVCDTCYKHATGINKRSIISSKQTRHPNRTILFGDFRCISSNSIVWIDLQEDHQLHIYSARLDQVEDFSINLTELRDILLIEETRTFILNGKDKRYKFSIELNHQIIFQNNNYIDENVKNINNKPLFYTKLWYDTMQLARSKRVPLWYIRKRDSADSGISAVE